MRKIAGLVLVALGVAFIGLAVALPGYVYPRVAKMPVDPRTTIVATGSGVDVLLLRGTDEGGIRPELGKDVVVTRYITGDTGRQGPKPGPDDVLYRLDFRADVVGLGLLNAYVEGYAFDNDTAEASNCCRDYLRSDAGDTAGEPITHRGLGLKFPFDTQQRDYEFWDVNLRKATTARFDGEDTIQGLEVYRFVQDIPDQSIGSQEVPGALFGSTEGAVTADQVYADVRTLWVEPVTGAIIKGQEKVNRRLVADGSEVPIIRGTIAYDDKTVTALVDQYRDDASQLRLVSKTGPLVAWIAGPLLLLGGLALLLLAGPSEEDHDAEPADALAPSNA